MIVNKIVEIKNKHGLHARPSASFVKMANQYQSDITIECDSCRINGKSVLGLLSLGAGKGTKFKIIADGNDAREAINNLKCLVESGFNEE